MGIIENWKAVLTKPEETLAAEKGKADIMGGLKNFTIAALVPGIIIGLVISLISAIAAPFIGVIPGAQGLAIIGMLAVIIIPILAVIAVVIGSLVMNLLLWLAAKIVGGNGSFETQYYLLSVFAAPLIVAMVVAYIIMGILLIIPFVGFFLSFIVFGFIIGYLQIIGLVAYVSVIKQTHNFDTYQTALVTGVYTAILMGLYGLLVMAILIPFMMLGMSQAANPVNPFGM